MSSTDPAASAARSLAPAPLPRAPVAAGVLAAVFTAVLVVSYVVVPRPESGYLTFWDGWLATVVGIFPIVALVAAVVLVREHRWGWSMMAAGTALNVAGNLLYAYRDQNQVPVPNPGPNDGAYLASYVAFAVGLTILTRPADRRLRSQRLDGLIAGLSGAAVATALFFAKTLAVSGDAAQVAVGLAYPLFDLVFVVVLLAGVAANGYRLDRSSSVLVLGTVIFAVGDVIYLNQSAADTYTGGTWLEGTWVVGAALFGLAPWVRAGRRPASGQGSPVLAWLPAGFAFVSLGLLALAPFHSMPPIASVLAAGAVALTIARTLGTVRELRRANENHRLARTDELTALHNRRSFLEHLDRHLLGSPERLAVLIVDLDGFKEVNDTFGHHAGDNLLVDVAGLFARTLAPDAFLARLGGDEFGVVLPHADEGQATGAAQLLLDALTQPFHFDGVATRVGASIGVAAYPQHGVTRAELLQHADVAMYHAKHHHHGTSSYDPGIDPNSRDRLELLGELRSAVAAKAFVMHYQPLLDVRTGAITGVEALVRWPHPARGLLYPDTFIPLAEHTGLIPQLTRVVIALSVAELAADRRSNGRELGLSINISGNDLLDTSLAEHLAEACEMHGYPASAITLEVTETALVADPMRAELCIANLRAAGFHIAVDDFGVGYSSMAQLLNLSVDELKIDRSFVQGVEHDPRSRAIVHATIELARALGLHLVAEGVESPATLAFLTDAGCDKVQGYYVARAAPLERLAHRFEHWPGVGGLPAEQLRSAHG